PEDARRVQPHGNGGQGQQRGGAEPEPGTEGIGAETASGVSGGHGKASRWRQRRNGRRTGSLRPLPASSPVPRQGLENDRRSPVSGSSKDRPQANSCSGFSGSSGPSSRSSG